MCIRDSRNTGVLRIYGTGEMNDYRYKYDLLGKETVIETEAPWLEQGYTEELSLIHISYLKVWLNIIQQTYQRKSFCR